MAAVTKAGILAVVRRGRVIASRFPTRCPPVPTSVAEFAKAADESGILAAESLAAYVQDVASDSDATALANRLVKDGRLTAFQARCIYGGKAASLVLGPYVVLDVLGKGGMGYVYKAEHRTMRRIVAIKVIASTAPKSPAAVRRFEREVQAAARLDHPNIVTAFDAGEAAGTHYLVMQLVDGRTLSEVVKALGPQPVGRAVDWILQAARGLAYAHGKGVVHRDIKPGNLLVDQDGAVKILDMGLARLETLDADQDQLTGTGQIMGTVDYMAPEQAMDTRQADARSDIYSLGATLWYVMTARPLFEADSTLKKIMAHQQSPRPRLSDACASLDPRFDAVFQRMVARQPEDRFQSMAEVLAALEALPESVDGPGPPSIDFRAGPASLGPLGEAVSPVLMRPMATAAQEDTPRLSAADWDTDFGLKRAPRTPSRSVGRLNPLSLVVGSATVGAFVVIGLWIAGVGGRKPAGGGVPSSEVSASRPPSSPHEITAMPTMPSLPLHDSGGVERSPPIPAIAPFDTAQARRHQETWAAYLGIEVETTNSIGQTLVVIPPGLFTMGENDATVDVTLTTPFLLGQTEVTQGQWQKVMGTEPWKAKPFTAEAPDVAATFISWDDATTFCTRLTEQERRFETIRRDQEYRLPTEVEWEFACRAGTVTTFSFGDDRSQLGHHAWFGGGWKNEPIPGGNTAGEMYAHAVQSKRPNPFGLYDTHGNVWEWVAARHRDDPRPSVLAPQGPPRASGRVLRGGSWDFNGSDCRSAVRIENDPSFRDYHRGFRVALTLP